MKKKITWVLICALIVICGWNVTQREWDQAGKKDSEYRENNANARAQSSDGQDVSLEEVLQETETSVQETETSVQDSGSGSGSENENITGDSGSSSEKTESSDEKTDADDSIKTDETKSETDVADNTVTWNTTIQNEPAAETTVTDKTAEEESTEVSYDYETGYIFLGDSRFYLMNEECKIEDIPNFFVVSCPGMGYTWLADTAFPKVQALQRQHKEIKNWVVVCGLGINDLTSIQSYLNKYRRWPDSSKLYLLSVNPTKGGVTPKNNNRKIELFNKRLKKVDNATYLDCYQYLTKVGFDTQGDGVHYDSYTNWKIYSYILEQLNKRAGGDPATEAEAHSKAKQLERQLSQKSY